MATIYRPLNDEIHEIRVLNIVPTAFTRPEYWDDHPLELELEYVSLDGNTRYHALSYTWQSDIDAEIGLPVHPRVSVSINGQKLQIPKNLSTALFILRNWATFTTLKEEFWETPFPPNMRIWVDALCINQSDVEERNSQVSQMRRIYQKAAGVNAWLGPEANNSKLVFDFMNDGERPLAQKLGQKYQTSEQREADDRDWVQRQIKNPSKEAEWIALAALLDRRYWRRTWIVQELLSNRNTFVQCGSGVARIDPFIQTAVEVVKYGQNNPRWSMLAEWSQNTFDRALGSISIAPINFILNQRDLFTDPQYRSPSLLVLLMAYQSHGSTDNRDKVFGLVGLAKAQRENDFIIDYSLSAHEVFKNAACYIIRDSESLSIIVQACNGRCRCLSMEHIALGLPSWVPNWTCRPGDYLTSSRPPSNAGSTVSPKVTFSHDGYALSASGLFLGTIERVYHIPYGTAEQMRESGNIKKALKYLLISMSPPTPRAAVADISFAIYEKFIKTRGFPSLLNSLSLDHFTRMCSAVLEDTHEEDSSFEDEKITLIFAAAFTGRSLLSYRSAQLSASKDAALEFGVCHPIARTDDLIAILRGCFYPLVLRERTRKPKTYVKIGEVYLQEYMHGEAFGQFPEQDFEIY